MIKYVLVLLVGFALGIITERLKKEKIIELFYHNAKILIIVGCLMLVLLFTYFAYRINLLDALKNNPEQVISVYVTVIIAIITGCFALYQLLTLKNRDVLKLYDLYDNLNSLLDTHVTRVLKYVNTLPVGASIKMSGYCFSQEEINRIHELSFLLNQHAKFGNSKKNAIKRIELINRMHNLMCALNNFYNLLDKYDFYTAFNKANINIAEANKIIKDIKNYRDNLTKSVGKVR